MHKISYKAGIVSWEMGNNYQEKLLKIGDEDKNERDATFIGALWIVF